MMALMKIFNDDSTDDPIISDHWGWSLMMILHSQWKFSMMILNMILDDDDDDPYDDSNHDPDGPRQWRQFTTFSERGRFFMT